MSIDTVRVVVPARGEYAKVVRMTASSIAQRAGMAFDAVEDVRLIAEEAFIHALECTSESDPVEIVFGVSLFSVGASGFLIENGVVTRPVKGVAIAGNIVDLFARIEAVGYDLRFYGSIASPSFRIGYLDVSGA